MRRFLTVPTIVLAAVPGLAAASEIQDAILSVLTVVRYALATLFMLALAAFGWGVVKFILAAQDPEALKKSKGTMLWSVVAMFVLASIVGIITLFQTYFGVGGSNAVQPPQF